MASTSAKPIKPSSIHIVHRGGTGSGPYMLTLCRLAEPASIQPPQSPRLRLFTFFTSRLPQCEGGEQLYLHMGFFETLADAETHARALRGRYPDAIATIAPTAFRQLPATGARAARSADPQHAAADSPRPAPAHDPLIDTQRMLSILGMRRAVAALNDGEEPGGERVELLRPEDTGTRRALKEAVVRGEPVSFAVQLHWSARPIDPGQLPALAVFKGHALYVVENRHTNRSCFFLRLGFFADPLSARQAASRLHSSFAAAAVVPVLDEEVARARAACVETASLPCLVYQRPEPATPGGSPAPKPGSGQARNAPQPVETLEQTLAQLAEREMWIDSDPLSDSGVRHIKVRVEERPRAGRY